MADNAVPVGTEAIATDNQPQAEAQSQEQKAPQQGEQQAAKPVEPPRRHKLKIDSREEEVDEAQVLRDAQLVRTANKRMEEVARSKNQIAKLLETIKGNPIEALMDPALGLSKEQIKSVFENWYKSEFIDPEMLTPEQRKLKEYEQKEKAWEAARKEKEQSEAQSRLALEQQHWAGEYEKQIMKGLETKALPKNASTVRAMAAYMQQAVNAGIEVPIETIADLVHNDKVTDAKSILGSMDGDQILKFVGEEIVNKIRKADLARLRGGQAVPKSHQASASVQATEPNKGQGKPISMADARKYFDKL